MARCPLCGKRAARRECPAKAARICSVCCGTLREVEIDCPSDCSHLMAGRAWEAGRPETAPARPRRQFSEQFVYRNGASISALSQAIIDQRDQQPALVDADVRAALGALEVTVRTLESGLYYETLPEGSTLATAVYRAMKSVLDELMESGAVGLPLKIGDAQAILEFLVSTCDFYASDRPKSRRYLDWLATMVPERTENGQPDRLILP